MENSVQVFRKTDVQNGGRPSILPPPLQNGKPEASALLAKVRHFHQVLTQEMSKVIVGQKEVIDLILAAMLCRGHVLLEGVPGLGKTLLFRTLSKILNLEFQHIQFTPDLMPSDIIGTEIIENHSVTHERVLKFLKGPVFCHFLLADEINRTSPKTQAALLQAMQDHEVSVGRKIYRLEEPFFVLATQNPIDQEGTYPLPEAQLDRFMMNIYIHYPTYEQEVEIAERFTAGTTQEVAKIVSREEILQLQSMVRGMLISESVLRYAVDLVVASRPRPDHPLPFVREWIEWGASPRATLSLVMAAKALALLKGSHCVSCEDIRVVAPSVLRHRIKMNFSAEAENITAIEVIGKLLAAVPEQKKRS